jgi:hypothetical protein
MASLIQSVDSHWQTPAITEYHSFLQLKRHQWQPAGYIYVAFPWATLIDLLQTGRQIPETLAQGFEDIIKQCRLAKRNNTLITVCQHIYAQRFSPLFKASHVQIVYWSHATFQDAFHDGLEWRPHPLYPVQRYSSSREGSLKALEKRHYLASFIGAFDAKYYLSSIREEIFKLATLGGTSNLLIQRRDNWHFQDEVYSQQIYGLEPEEAKRKLRELHAAQYREALMESIYCLCPSGSGPNSIRLWESLTYGSIPFVFADNLALPGEPQLWLEACIFMSEAATHLEIAEAITRQAQEKSSELKSRQAAGRILESRYGIHVFVWDLLQLENNRSLSAQTMEPKRPSPMKKLAIQTRLLIIDPGLKNVGSHHHKINSQLASDLGHDHIRVLSHQLLSQSEGAIPYSFKPIFSYSTYDDLPDLSSADYCHQVERLSQELVTELRESGDTAWLYIHTATAAQIQMMANAVALVDGIYRPKGIYLQLMFEPRSLYGLHREYLLPRSTARYKSALQSLSQICRQSGLRLLLETSNPIFQQVFTQLIPDQPIGLHPHLFSHSSCDPPGIPQASGPWRCLLHSGDPRPGKGLAWIAAEIEAWIQGTGEDIQFVFHSGRLRYPQAFPDIATALENIAAVAKCHPERFDLYSGYLSDAEWQTMVCSTDALALLHEPEFYQYKTSGAVLDYLQITSGSRPVMISANTNSSDILKYYDINHSCIEYGNGASFLRAIKQSQELPIPGQSKGWDRFFHDFFARSPSQHLVALLAAEPCQPF